MAKSSTLVVPPYLGEFGWELMNWQGRVRQVIREGPYDRVYLAAAPDRRTIYADLIDGRRVRFCPMPRFDWPGEANDDHRINADGIPITPPMLAAMLMAQVEESLGQQAVDADGAEWLMPPFDSSLWPTKRGVQRFMRLRKDAPIASDVVLVARMRTLAGERNQPAEWWTALAERLSQSGLRVAAYASTLGEAVRQLSLTRLAVGASTGGLHLASLCECPHYVWGPGPEARWTPMRITNRQRYETIWNPFGVACLYDELGWRPTLDQAVSGITRALGEIALAPDGGGGRGLRSRWRIKRGLARILEAPAGKSRWPWRVQELVRTRLV